MVRMACGRQALSEQVRSSQTTLELGLPTLNYSDTSISCAGAVSTIERVRPSVIAKEAIYGRMTTAYTGRNFVAKCGSSIQKQHPLYFHFLVIYLCQQCALPAE